MSGISSRGKVSLCPARVVLLAVLVILRGLAARGATIFVTNSSGGSSGPGCTLRDAITAANSDMLSGDCPKGDPGLDVIELSPGVTYTLDAADNVGDDGPNGLPLITSAITINGHGSTIARARTAPRFRLFEVAATGELELNHVTVTGGFTQDSSGLGGVPATDCSFPPGYEPAGPGGAILNRGTARVIHCSVTLNQTGNGREGTATAGASNGDDRPRAGGSGGDGGGIANLDGTMTVASSTIGINMTGNGGRGGTTVAGGNAGRGGGICNCGGTVTVSASTISDNVTGDGGNGTRGGDGGDGGGIFNRGRLTAANSTFSGNATGSAGGQGGEDGDGGGIFNDTDGTAALTNATVVANVAGTSGNGGGLLNRGNLTTTNTLIAGNIAANCSGPITDGGHNLQFHPSSGCAGTAADPVLDPNGLADNGGPTRTVALFAGSAAANQGDGAACAAPPVNGVDQRGATRLGGGGRSCDIGAFQRGAAPPPPPDDDDNDGVDNAVEIHGPNGGDGNGDGIADAIQPNVTSLPSAAHRGYVTVEVDDCTQNSDVRAVARASLGTDRGFDYPFGLVHLKLTSGDRSGCGNATVTVFFHGALPRDGLVYRKFGPTPPKFDHPHFYTLPGVAFGSATVGSATVPTATFSLSDARLGDDVGPQSDGMIVDTGGPATASAGDATVLFSVLAGVLALLGLLAAVRLSRRRRRSR